MAGAGAFANTSANGLADLPMMPKRIHDAAQPPAILIIDGSHNRSSSRHCLSKCSIRILYNHHHSGSAAAKRFRAKIQMFDRQSETVHLPRKQLC